MTACEPAPLALAHVMLSEPTITRRVTDAGCGWDAILADGVARATAGRDGSFRRHPNLVADELRRVDLGRLPDDSSQSADAARVAVDELVGDRFRRGGGPVGVALTGDLYPPFPPDDVRSPARQAVALGAAVAAAGLAGRVRARSNRSLRWPRPRADDRRPVGGRTPPRRTGSRTNAPVVVATAARPPSPPLTRRRRQCGTRPPLTTISWPETNAESSDNR